MLAFPLSVILNRMEVEERRRLITYMANEAKKVTRQTNIDELPVVPLSDTERMRRYWWGEQGRPSVQYPIILSPEDFRLPHFDLVLPTFKPGDIEPMV